MNNQYAPPSTNLDQPGGEGGITGAMLEALRKTRVWVMMVGVLMFVTAAFTVLGGLAVIFMGSSASAMSAGMTAGMSVIYMLFAFVYSVLGFYLMKYSGAISRLLRDGSSLAMEMALQYQQKFWRLAGFVVMIFMLFFVVGIGTAIIIPALMTK